MFSRNNFLFLDKSIYTVKLKNKRKLKWGLTNYKKGKIKQKFAAKYLGITTRRFHQILTRFEKTGEIPLIGIKTGRPKNQISDKWKQIIIKEFEEYKLNALYLKRQYIANTE